MELDNAVIEMARRLLDAARAQGITLKALGGIGVRLLCPAIYREFPLLQRQPSDIDLAGFSEDSNKIDAIFKAAGLTPDTEFNFLNIGERLRFHSDNCTVDVFTDSFRMCQKWPIRKRLRLDSPDTLPVGDLLLTKLQVVQITEKDFKDIAALLLYMYEVDTQQDISLQYIKSLCGRNWGLYHSAIQNLSLVVECDAVNSNPSLYARIRQYAGFLITSLKESRKNFYWHIRAVIGTRILWYAEPDN